MYHGIPSRNNDTGVVDAKVFERHIAFLQQHFEFVSPSDVDRKRKPRDRIQVALTFDDGFRNHAEVVAPILRRYNVPALFFISSRHSQSGKYLWFSYLEALETHFRGDGFNFRGELLNMSPIKRRNSIDRLRDTLLNLEPHPSAMYEAIDNELPRLEDFVSSTELLDKFAGMTEEQVGELASDPLFSVGIHTVDHPLLTKCQPQEAYRQIAENKLWIETISNKACDIIAYPLGDYNAQVLEQCRGIGIRQGHAVIPALRTHREYERSRVGVFGRSLDLLGFKVQWGTWVRVIQSATGTQSIDFNTH